MARGKPLNDTKVDDILLMYHYFVHVKTMHIGKIFKDIFKCDRCRHYVTNYSNFLVFVYEAGN